MLTSFEGTRVVVTGKIAGETRQSVEAKFRQAGALVQSSVTGDTEVLVTGEAVGATKLNAAKAKGVTIVPWPDAQRVLAGETIATNGNGSAPVAAAPKVKRAGAFSPMLAKGSDRIPDGDGWLFEIKWDGYRCVATVEGGQVTLTSRSGLGLEFAQIEQELASLPACVLDGEVVVLDERGRSSFQAIGNGHTAARFMVFDVVEVDGGSVRDRPLAERRQLLARLLQHAQGTWVAESPTFTDGAALLAHAAQEGLEGIVAKRTSSPYRDGARGPAWLKIKLRVEQEFAVLGWTPERSGDGTLTGGLGALILGVAEDGGFRFCGKVGTGWTEAEGHRLLGELGVLETVTRPEVYAGIPDEKEYRTEARWAAPGMVVQVQFQHWTDDGRLWHPSYKGQRFDKKPSECRREVS
jgi:bifunctional non-homologous end joining protein LigD